MFSDQLMFFREVMELRPTEDNIQEESAPYMSSACEEETPSGPAQVDTAPGPSTAPSRPPPVSGADSPPTPLAVPSRPRRRAMAPSEANINTQVLDYLSRARQEDEFDLYARSLASYLCRMPPERVLRTQSALNIILDTATPPQQHDRHLLGPRKLAPQCELVWPPANAIFPGLTASTTASSTIPPSKGTLWATYPPIWPTL
ncbi:uncharacterized protein LOC122946011 [Bufo gargarizans]|uniref:uncharacterized protein LOC122946011 n=1 Tax=Bufo gargarizans TaxID=30331 RepID=UPI001CF52334|nr:uncharacterized protein LOC122946011 [Bufo gargarizans]